MLARAVELLQKINEELLELLIGILIWGGFAQLAFVWFVPDKKIYSLCLWIGIGLAAFAAVHMWWSIDRNLSENPGNEKRAQAKGNLYYMIRYFIALFVFYMVAKYYGPYFLAAALGERGISAAAHMQPIVKRFIYDKYIKREVTL